MRPKDIDRFFKRLGERVSFPVTVILTGGGAAILEGVSRATRDLDFQIALKNTSQSHQLAFQSAIQYAENKTGIQAQYETDIGTWSSISWPSKRPRSYPYHRFGRVQVRILDPLYWSIGKMARFLAYDISDVATVFKTMNISGPRAARAWGKALGRSPMSNAQPLFKRQVFAFFQGHGKKLWGRSTNPEILQRIFLTAARAAHGSHRKRRTR